MTVHRLERVEEDCCSGTYAITAGVYTEFSGHGNGSTEEEDNVESVEGNRNDGMAGERFVKRNCY